MASVGVVDHFVSQVAQGEPELVDLLARLVAFETVSPPARNTIPVQAWLEELLAAIGFEVERCELYPGDRNLIATRRGSDPQRFRSLIVNGHLDVAEVGDPSVWLSPPFALTQTGDGRLRGRGVADMKGAIAAVLFVLRELDRGGIDLGGDLHLHLVTGEEAGEAGTRTVLERGLFADFALIVDASDLHLQGQGGVITGWITVESPTTFHDGMRRRLIHAGGGVDGASAIEKMATLLTSLQTLERHWAVTKAHPGFPPGANTINPAVIEGGRHAAFIADRCALWITVHFYPDETPDGIAQEVERHVMAAAAADPWLRQNPPTFRWGGRSMIEERGEVFPALRLDRDHPAVRALADAYDEQVGEPPVLDMCPSVTDAGWYQLAGIPAVLFGPGQLAEAHATNESIDPAQLVTFAQILARFLVTWCNTAR